MKHLVLIAVVVAAGRGCIADPESHQPSTESATRPATQPTTSPDKGSRERIKIAGEEFHFEIAANPESRAKGLMWRQEIAPDGGMLFIYPRITSMTFWMAHCPIDIDVAFLDIKGKVLALYEMKAEAPQGPNESQADYEARLTRYLSLKPAFFALEFKAGTIKRLKIQRGQTIDMDCLRLRKLAS